MDSTGAGIYGSQSRDDFDRDDVEQVRFRPGEVNIEVLPFSLAV